MTIAKLQNYLKEKHVQFESVCLRCGECCGALDDPCRNLTKNPDGAYHCKDYKNRLGPQFTRSGKFFTCVSIEQHIKNKTLAPGCAYRVQ